MNGSNWHRLGKNHGSEGPENIVSVYCAMTPTGGYDKYGFPVGDYVFTEGYAIGERRKNGKWYGKGEISFTNTDVFWAWVKQWCRRKSPAWVYSYEWTYQSQLLGLWHELDNGNLKIVVDYEKRKEEGLAESKENKQWVGLCSIENCPFIVYVVGKTGTLKFCDTLNYTKASPCRCMNTDSARIGLQSVGGATCAACICTTKSVATQIHSSVVGIMSMWQKESKGTWQPTVGRLAISNFKHRFSDNRIVVHKPAKCSNVPKCKKQICEHMKNDPVYKAKELEREAYIGGEFRHWYNGYYSGYAFNCDITGHYAAIMRDCELPYLLTDYREGDSCKQVGELQGWDNCIASVLLETKEDHFPVKINGVIRWPIGKFSTVLCGPELEHGIKTGVIKEVSRIASYKKGKILENYARHWIYKRNECREKCDSEGEELAKAMLVSLPGKLGAKGNKWQIRESQHCPERWGVWASFDGKEGQIRKFRAIAGVAQCDCVHSERLDSMIAVPAFVCAEGRKKMRDFRLTLGEKSVLLQQNDSFLLTEGGYENGRKQGWFNGEGAGSWRIKHPVNGVYVWNANQWQEAKSQEGEHPIGCFAGIPATSRQVDLSEWRVGTKRGSGQAIVSGPSRTVVTGTSTEVIKDTTGNFGHRSNGWCGALVTFQEHEMTSVWKEVMSLESLDSVKDETVMQLCQRLLFS